MSRDAAPARLHKQGYFGTRAKTIEGFEAIEKCLREKAPIVVTSVDFDGTATTTVHWHPDGPTGGVIASVGAMGVMKRCTSQI